MADTDTTQLVDIETKAAFVTVDEDNDGYITHDELRACLRQLTGVKRLPDKLIVEALEEADQNKSGKINYEEFCNAIATCTLLETIINVFIKVDKDRSGHITPDELRQFIDDLPNVSREQVKLEEVLKLCDLNHDGALSFEEFANHMLNDMEFGDGHISYSTLGQK